MTTPAERARQVELVTQLKPTFPDVQDAPYPDQINHERFAAYMKTPHDVGGEPDAPIQFMAKQYEQWELNTYILCEVLGWRGIWVSEERRRIQNVDIGRSSYLGLPYYGRWLLTAARILIEKHYATLGELIERMEEVKQRYEGGLDGKPLEAHPKFEGDGSAVARNHHHTHAVGKGDPGVFADLAGEAKFTVGDEVIVRQLPTLFYTRTQEYVRGAKGTIATVAYESLAPEDEAWDRQEEKPEWFYIVRFNLSELWPGYTGTTADTVQTEIPERWLTAA